MHRHADFKNKGEAQAEKLHGTGAGARQAKQTNIRKDTGDIVYKIDTEKFTEKPSAMGTSPSTVVMAVSMTGRKRTTPACTNASRTPIPRDSSCCT